MPIIVISQWLGHAEPPIYLQGRDEAFKSAAEMSQQVAKPSVHAHRSLPAPCRPPLDTGNLGQRVADAIGPLRAGETFEAVAADYGVSVSDLRNAVDAIAA